MSFQRFLHRCLMLLVILKLHSSFERGRDGICWHGVRREYNATMIDQDIKHVYSSCKKDRNSMRSEFV